MRVFVTGGSGFVGGHAIRALVAQGHEVVALARSDRSASAVEALGARAVRNDLTEVVAADLAGADAIVHAAAFVEEYGTREQFWSINVDGTTRLLDAAREAGVRRFVHIGTEAVLFDGSDLVGVDETHPYPKRQRFLYSETKAEAERRVLAANAPDFTTISLRPRLVWGPGDATILPAVLRMARTGGWVWLDGGRKRSSTVHVANVAHGIALALTQGRGGEAYFLADDGDVTIREFLTSYAKTAGVELPDRSVPGGLVRPAARAMEGLWRMLGIRSTPPLVAISVAMLSREITVRTEKARTELGYAPKITREQGFRELAAG